jgi:argininosuccinate lyase
VKMWSGRFRQPLDPEFEKWQRSFPFDQLLIKEEVAASAAHARALQAAGVLTREELETIANGLRHIAEHADELLPDDSAEDVHHFIEKQLVAAIGEAGYKLHTGRSRNEQIATDMRLYVRAQIDGLRLQLAELIEALIAKAEKAGAAAMPSYTHLQRAEPVLVAHWLLAYCEMLFRDAGRLADCRERLNRCPLGSGAIAGATLKLDRESVATELEFAGPTANSMDATSDRDFALEFVQALSVLAVHLSRWAEEFILFSTTEYGFAQLPESFSTGSSAMPQKKNPDALELVRGKSGRILADANSLLITLKGLPLAYNKDMQETQEPVFDAAQNMTAMLRTATGFTREVTFNYERMTGAASVGFMNAMAAATYLVGKGVAFRRAHEYVGNAVRVCLGKHCELEDLSLEELKKIAPEFGEDFYAAVTLEATLACHDVPGGTAPGQVKMALETAREQLSRLRGGVHAFA